MRPKIDGELLAKGTCNSVLALLSLISAAKQIKNSGVIEYGKNRVTELLSKAKK